MTDFFLVHRDPEYVSLARSAIATVPGGNLAGQCASAKDALFLLGSTKARVAIIQLALPDMDGLKLAAQLIGKYPDLYVVPVLEGTEGGEVWQRILQLNLRHVINGPADAATIGGVLKQAAGRAAEIAVEVSGEDGSTPRGNSYMIAVAGARGGMGKTIFATNLAVCMARLKANTCLIDISMTAGDFFTMLDYVPRHTLADAIAAKDQLDANFLGNLISTHPAGFKFLACPNQDFDIYGMDYNDSVNLLKISRGLSEYTIVDTGAYDLPPTAAAIDEADVVFMVTSRDLSRLLSLQRFIKSLKEREFVTEKLKIIVNNAEVGTEISEAEIESVLDHPVAAYLPSIPALTTFSINSGNPLALSKPDHPFCAVTHRLAEISMNHWIDDGGA